MSVSDVPMTVAEVSRALSVSAATLRNWIRLGKITPDAGEQLFSREYVSAYAEQLRSEESTRLKSRRNKKGTSGRVLYKNYVRSEENRRLAAELLESGLITGRGDLMAVLANFAVQLYHQSRGIPYTGNDLLSDYLSGHAGEDFHILVTGLLGGVLPDSDTVTRLAPALNAGIRFVRGEDSLGFIYISLRDIGQRKSAGAYYTPEDAVDGLIDLLCGEGDLSGKTVCDPCCGTGNFLLRLAARGTGCQLYGQDIDPVSAALTRINLALTDPALSAEDICARITSGDSLTGDPGRSYDVILGNPPWGSDLPEAEISACCGKLVTASDRNPEIYDLFTEKALTMLSPGGVLAFVLPEAILSVASHDTVRRLMTERCSFRFVSYLGNVFPGVQCPSVILGIMPDSIPTSAGCRVRRGKESYVISQNRSFEVGVISLNISDQENEIIKAMDSVPDAVYLKGSAKFALGIVTGSNKELVLKERQEGFEPVLKGRDITRYGITPPDNFIRFTPERFQQVAPTELYRAKEKLLYRFICEVPVFAYDDGQRLTLNSCNILIPQIEGLSMKYVLAVLNSGAAAFYINRRFRSVKLLRSHIEQLPIPAVPVDIQKRIAEKTDRIMLSKENKRSLYDELDREITRLYGLMPEQAQIIERFKGERNLFL